MATSAQSFGQWVREQRKRRNLTQKALGLLIGYAEITVRQIEKEVTSGFSAHRKRTGEVLLRSRWVQN